MPRPTYDQAEGLAAESAEPGRGLELLYALLASGTYSDSSPFSLPSRPASLDPLGYQQLAVSGVATLTVPTGATWALVIPSVAVRWRDDGTNPTVGTGMPLSAGAWLEYNGDLAAFRAIATGSAGVLDISYY